VLATGARRPRELRGGILKSDSGRNSYVPLDALTLRKSNRLNSENKNGIEFESRRALISLMGRKPDDE
jgi:hypothetical protein